MTTLIENYINGNLIDAKRQAKCFTALDIVLALKNEYGYTVEKATAVALYLKTGKGWEEVCNER